MSSYSYPFKPASLKKLSTSIEAAGLPETESIEHNPSTLTFFINFSEPLPSQQVSVLNEIVSLHTPLENFYSDNFLLTVVDENLGERVLEEWYQSFNAQAFEFEGLAARSTFTLVQAGEFKGQLETAVREKFYSDGNLKSRTEERFFYKRVGHQLHRVTEII
jgi:hypothetical protein